MDHWVSTIVRSIHNCKRASRQHHPVAITFRWIRMAPKHQPPSMPVSLHRRLHCHAFRLFMHIHIRTVFSGSNASDYAVFTAQCPIGTNSIFTIDTHSTTHRANQSIHFVIQQSIQSIGQFTIRTGIHPTDICLRTTSFTPFVHTTQSAYIRIKLSANTAKSDRRLFNQLFNLFPTEWHAIGQRTTWS